MINVHILLGGMAGPDGWVDSGGMFDLRRQLAALPNVACFTYTWNDWQKAANDIAAGQGHNNKIALIGYSGGGSRATWLANWQKPSIDLMVLYDPSPAWQMQPIGENVHKAVNYHNTNPAMWVPFVGQLGGGVLVGPNVTSIDIAEQHLLVQFNQSLHARTVGLVQQLAAPVA